MGRLAELVSSEYGWILAQSMRLCRNRMDAEDLAGESVLKILRSPGAYDLRRPFRPWCSVIILNTFLTKYRRDSLITFVDDCQGISCTCCGDTSQRILVSEILSAIRRCRKRSSAVDSVIMYARGNSYEEIASHFGIPPGTVRSRINYGRMLIRKELDIQYVK